MINPTVVICSSASFYKHVNQIKLELEAQGITIVVPKNAKIMAERNDYDVSHYKTWYNDANDYSKKAEYMRGHFDEITKGDIVLIVNDEKHGVPNYIGPNVLLEMGLAWYQNKPIYILNDLPNGSPFEEEIKGFMPTVLKGSLDPFIASTRHQPANTAR